jgi:hypothetical protein
MFNFFIGCLLIVVGISFLKDAYSVFKGQMLDSRGNPLWVYAVLRKKIPVAKDKTQALLVTLMCAFLSCTLGAILTGSLLVHLFKE